MPRPPLSLATGVALALALLTTAPTHANSAKIHDVPLPRGARAVPDTDQDLFVSRQTFRRTVDFYTRFLNRSGLAHEAVPIYEHRGTTVARFLSREKGSRWSAIHVFHRDGRTLVAVLPAP